MATYKVNVDKLNLRSSPVQDYSKKKNVVGVLRKDAVFESVRIVENELGRWPVNREGHSVSENFLSEIVGDIPPELVKYHDKIPKIFLDFHLGKLWELPMEEGLSVGIIDSGVIKNDAIKQEIIDLNPEFQIADKGMFFHGTTMACIIAGFDPENGIIGIAPEIDKIYSYKLPEENTTPDMYLMALQKMKNHNVKIINISCGSYDKIFSTYDELQNQIIEMAKTGSLIVCSTGNKGIDRNIFYPASYGNVISVTGVLKNGNQDFGSNFWKNVTLGACSDFYFADTKIFHHACGTSSAAAIITGCLARMYKSLSKNNPMEYFKSIVESFKTVQFSSVNQKVEVFQLDSQTIINQLKI